MDGTGTIDQASSGAATETSQPVSSNGSEPVASDGAQAQENNAGGSQESSESGGVGGTDTRKAPFRSKNQTIYELRQKVRERDAQYQQFEERLSKFEQMFTRGKEPKPQRTFYEAPEDTLREIQQENLKSFKDELLTELRQTQDERDQQISLRQETSEAVKFIRSQKGMTDDDIQEIRELLVSDPRVQRLADAPMEQAEYVLYLYNKNKGVTDKTGLKNRAVSVQGAPPQGGGPKQWNEGDIAQEFAKIGDPKKGYTPEQKQRFEALKTEIRNAYRENRVKK